MNFLRLISNPDGSATCLGGVARVASGSGAPVDGTGIGGQQHRRLHVYVAAGGASEPSHPEEYFDPTPR